MKTGASRALCCYLSQSVGCKNRTGSVTSMRLFVAPVPWWTRQGQREGGVEWDLSACDRETTQLQEYERVEASLAWRHRDRNSPAESHGGHSSASMGVNAIS